MPSANSSRAFAIIGFTLGAIIMPNANAGFGSESFGEDPAVPQEEQLEWPEAEFPPAEVRGRGFRDGERFEYRAQWGIFRKAGAMVVTTEAEEIDGERKLVVTTETSSAGLVRRFYAMSLNATSILDPESWRMERNVTDGHTRSELNKSRTLFDYERRLMRYEDEGEPARNRTRHIPYDAPMDYTSCLLQLRGMDLEVGGVYPIFVITKGKFYYVELKAMDTETLRTDLGRRECFRLEPVTAYPESKLFREGGSMAIWISNDAERLPVRFDVRTNVGTATMQITDYSVNGQQPSLARR